MGISIIRAECPDACKPSTASTIVVMIISSSVNLPLLLGLSLLCGGESFMLLMLVWLVVRIVVSVAYEVVVLVVRDYVCLSATRILGLALWSAEDRFVVVVIIVDVG